MAEIDHVLAEDGGRFAPPPDFQHPLQVSTFLPNPETELRNVRENVKRGLPELQGTFEAHGTPMHIVSGGPSLKDEFRRLKTWKRTKSKKYGKIWAINGAHDFLCARGIIPHYQVMADHSPKCADLYCRNPRRDVRYFVASQCDPSVFEALDGYDVTLWHSYLAPPHDEEILKLASGRTIGGGSTSAMRAMYIGFVMGYRHFDLFGMDSSYEDDSSTHAYRDVRDELKRGRDMQVWCAGREFRTAIYMAAQAQEMVNIIGHWRSEPPWSVKAYGDGLLPHCLNAMKGVERDGFGNCIIK